MLEKKRQPVPTNEDAIVMKQLAIEILGQHGYKEEILRRVRRRHPEHYSHYAHNQCCRLVDEVGFGLTAFSSLVDVSCSTPPTSRNITPRSKRVICR